MLQDLNGRRVLVTGASTGIGAAVADGFARHGADVAVHYNASADKAEAVAAAIRSAGGVAHTVGADLTTSEGCTAAVGQAVAALGGLDILVNNAGALVRRTPLDEMDDEIYDAVMDLNVRSVIMTTKAAHPHLAASGSGVVINVSSVAARNGAGPGAGLYGSAKAFVLNYTRSLAKELAPDGIRVNGVAPGIIMTPFHERYSTPDWLETQRKLIPMQRIGTPADTVGVFLFLASNAMSGYVTGQTIDLNGGQYMP